MSKQVLHSPELTAKQRLAVSRLALAVAAQEPVWLSVLQRCIERLIPLGESTALAPAPLGLKTQSNPAAIGRTLS